MKAIIIIKRTLFEKGCLESFKHLHTIRTIFSLFDILEPFDLNPFDPLETKSAPFKCKWIKPLDLIKKQSTVKILQCDP